MSAALVSWNVAGRLKKLAAQAERVVAQEPDWVCLQEVTATSAPPWIEALAAAGLEHVALSELRARPDARRPLGVLVAARAPLAIVPVEGLPWPERVLSVRSPGGTEVVTVHSPISPSPDLAKVLTHEAVFAHLARESRRPRLLCGDFNTPRREHPDGRVWSFARDRYGRLREDRGERWDAAELALLKGLEAHGFRDAFRALHGYERKEPSWEWPRWGGGYRLDHLIVSSEVDVEACDYRHEWRRDGLSDHSALVASFSHSTNASPGSGRVSR